jgi:hypothetical protein
MLGLGVPDPQVVWVGVNNSESLLAGGHASLYLRADCAEAPVGIALWRLTRWRCDHVAHAAGFPDSRQLRDDTGLG